MAIIGGAAIAAGGTMYAAHAAKSAADRQTDSANAANAQQRADQKPWMDAGKFALGQLTTGLQPGGQFTGQFSMADATNSDAEQHALQTGLTALDNSAAAKSGLLNSNALNATQDYAQKVAGSFQNQAFNQWLQSRQQNANVLESVSGLGQSTAGNVADNSANLTMAGGNAQAAGIIGQSNAVTQGVGQTIGTLSKLFGNTDPNSPNTMSNMINNIPGQATNDPTRGDYVSAVDAGGWSPSDERIKTDIKPIGKTHGGATIYTFRMKDGGPVRMGVMAQEIEQTQPHAVATRSDGLKLVNYREVA